VLYLWVIPGCYTCGLFLPVLPVGYSLLFYPWVIPAVQHPWVIPAVQHPWVIPDVQHLWVIPLLTWGIPHLLLPGGYSRFTVGHQLSPHMTVHILFSVVQRGSQGRLIPHNLIKLTFLGRTNSAGQLFQKREKAR